jgi:polyisoprenoid-binding protein YceI
VVEADFDPSDLTGATAKLEVQMEDLASGSAKRDNHLRSDDYLNVAKFPTATVKVAGVESSGDTTYDATATVTIHGVTAEWPITFEVIERTDDSIRIRSEKTFERTDFGVGAPSGEEDSVAPEMTVRVLLTLRPTS